MRNFGKTRYKILGTYQHHDLKANRYNYNRESVITIYLRNCIIPIYDGTPDVYDYETINSVFAHEMFHAFQYYLNEYLYHQNKVINCVELETDIMLESLASYFEASYALYHGYHNRVLHITDSWRRYSMYSYPYAGAGYIWQDDHRFKQLFDASMLDYAASFHHLVGLNPWILRKQSNKDLVFFMFVEAYLNGRIDQPFLNHYQIDNGDFLMNYAVIIKDDDITKGVERRYYIDLLNINGVNYRLCNDWRTQNIDELLHHGF